MRRESFSRLEGQWLYRAGKEWYEITDEHRNKTLVKLRDKWLFFALSNWTGIKQESIISLFINANNKYKPSSLSCTNLIKHIKKADKA